MAYNPRDLSVVGYANGFTLWHFRSGDPAGEILGRRYFDPSSEMLRAGDFIFVNLEDDAQSRGGILTVESIAGGSVRVAPLAGTFAAGSTSIAATNAKER